MGGGWRHGVSYRKDGICVYNNGRKKRFVWLPLIHQGSLTLLSGLIVLKIPVFLLELATHGDDLPTTVSVNPFLDLGQPLGGLPDKVLLAQIDHVYLRLGCDETPILDKLNLTVGKLAGLDRIVGLEQLVHLPKRGQKGIAELNLRLARHCLLLADALLLALLRLAHSFPILGTKLALDGIEITDRIDGIINVDDIVIIKATHQVENSIDGSNVRKESIAKTSTLRSAADETGNIGHLECGWDDARGLPAIYQILELLVGDDAPDDIGVDGAEGVVGGLGMSSSRQEIGQSRLANIGKAYVWRLL